MSRIRKTLCLALGALALTLLPAGVHAQKKTLVVALNQDPDLLDPTLARTYVGRIVFQHICEKLYDIDEHLTIQPQLAAALPAVSDGGKMVTIKLRPGVKFNDGTPMTAEAVKFSLDRHREMKGSTRRSELDHVTAVEVVDHNIHQFQTCGGSLNETLACDEKLDAVLNRARQVSDVAQRTALYREATDIMNARRNIVYLYFQNYIVAFPKSLKGYKAVPDGLIRVKGTSWQ